MDADILSLYFLMPIYVFCSGSYQFFIIFNVYELNRAFLPLDMDDAAVLLWKI
jgi:hypothetical protein